MGPFDLPPSTPPVSFDPPPPDRSGRRTPGRTAAVVAASAALVAAGVLAIAGFASSGDSPAANAAQDAGTTPPTPAPETAPATAAPETAPPTTAPTTAPTGDQSPDGGDLSGKIVIQIGDGDPIVIDLGDLGALGGSGGLGDLGNIEQCIGDLPFDIDLNAAPGGAGLPSFDVFGNGETVTVMAPNGLSVLTFGDGDGSVTITKKDGEISISSNGDVQENDLGGTDASVPMPSLPGLGDLPDFDHIYQCLEDATGAGQ